MFNEMGSYFVLDWIQNRWMVFHIWGYVQNGFFKKEREKKSYFVLDKFQNKIVGLFFTY